MKLLKVNERAEVIAILKQDQKMNLGNDNLKGDNFWFDGQPFIYSFGSDLGEKIEDIDPVYQNVKINRDEIAMELGLCAMFNGQKDHKILANLAIDILEKYKGYLDIDNYENAKPLPTFEHANVYRIEGVSTFVDLNFLRKWVEHQEFRLVK